MIDIHRGDVVLIAFPFVADNQVRRKRRPALVVQADRYNRRRAAAILAAITSSQGHGDLPCKVSIARDSPEGGEAGLRIDSVVDCQTLVTLPREEIVSRIGKLPPAVMRRIDLAIQDALGLAPP